MENHEHWVVSSSEGCTYVFHSEEEAYEFFVYFYVKDGDGGTDGNWAEFEYYFPEKFQIACTLIEQKNYKELLNMWNRWDENGDYVQIEKV